MYAYSAYMVSPLLESRIAFEETPEHKTIYRGPVWPKCPAESWFPWFPETKHMVS